MEMNSFTTSKHFDLQTLASGVYAAVALDGGSAVCNAGVIDLGNLVVVFDTFLTPSAAMDLKAAVISLTGRNADFVINSHYHNDHIWGNQVFTPDAVILSSTRTRQDMLTEGVEEYEYYSANAVNKLAEVRGQQSSILDPDLAADNQLWLGYYEGLAADLPGLTLPKPQITFDAASQIHGTSRSLHLLEFKGAHTESDLVLHLPDEGIVFASDLLFVGFHPYLGECNPEHLLSALQEIRLLNAAVFVPGHGAVGSRADLDRMMDYVQTCLDISHSLVRDGADTSRLEETVSLPVQFQALRMKKFYYSNLRSLCKFISAAGA